MNFFENFPQNGSFNIPSSQIIPPNPIMPNDPFFRINELENRLQKLEQRVTRLESNKQTYTQNQEPDNSMYMI